MATEIENPGGVVVEVPDDRAEQVLEQDGFNRPDEDASGEPETGESTELPGTGPVTVSNPGGAVVEVPREMASDVLDQDGFELAESEPDSPPAPPAPTPEPDESAEPEVEGEDSEQSEELDTENGEPGDVEELSVDQMLDRPDEEAAELALETDDFNTMRSVLAGLVDESTQGMGKPEVREALEQIQQ